MKYRIITDTHRGFTLQYKKWGIWWTCSDDSLHGHMATSFSNAEDAEEFMKEHIERSIKKKESGKIVKIIKVTTEDRVLWKLQKK